MTRAGFQKRWLAPRGHAVVLDAEQHLEAALEAGGREVRPGRREEGRDEVADCLLRKSVKKCLTHSISV